MRFVLVLLLVGCSGQPPGAWTWFNDPRAMRVGDTLLVGAVGPDGSITALTRKHGQWQEQRIEGPGKPDDHDNPAFLHLPDGRILAFYARHNSPRYMVAEAGSDLKFGTPYDIAPQIGGENFSYANPAIIDGKIALFYRCGRPPGWTICRADSSDGKAWTKGAALLASSGHRPYFKLATSPGRVDFVITDGHPNELSPNPIRHFYLTRGRYFASDGTPLGPPPIRIDSIPKVADHGWLWDIKPGLIAYTTFDRYHLARWDNGWRSEVVGKAGIPLYRAEQFYRGGVVIKDADTLYSSDGEGVFLHRKRDAWQPVKIGNGIRPYRVDGGLLWMDGEYRSYVDYDTHIAWRADED